MLKLPIKQFVKPVDAGTANKYIMKIKELFETASSMGAGDVATFIKGSSGTDVGTLFGGSYQQKSAKKPKAKKPRESILRR